MTNRHNLDSDYVYSYSDIERMYAMSIATKCAALGVASLSLLAMGVTGTVANAATTNNESGSTSLNSIKGSFGSASGEASSNVLTRTIDESMRELEYSFGKAIREGTSALVKNVENLNFDFLNPQNEAKVKELQRTIKVKHAANAKAHNKIDSALINAQKEGVSPDTIKANLKVIKSENAVIKKNAADIDKALAKLGNRK